MADQLSDKTLTFSLPKMIQLGSVHSEEFHQAVPWPHIVIDSFLPLPTAKEILRNFPGPDANVWGDRSFGDKQVKKLGIGNARNLHNLPPYMQNTIGAFQAYPFLKFLEKLTNIPKLLPDPYLIGGGLHQILSGGHLKVHTDFNHLPQLDLYRRINVLYYLNENWKSEYNGDLELWDAEKQNCVKSIAPLFNRLVVFITNKTSLHGHPAPLNTPPHITRKSLAFYYYTALPEDDVKYDTRVDWY